MAHYPTNPANGQTIGANLCPRPQLNGSDIPPWVGGSGVTGSVSLPPGSSTGYVLSVPVGGSKITLQTPNAVPVVPDTFKIWVHIATSTGTASVGVRPVGSARVIPANIGATGGANVYQSFTVTDSILAGDTGTGVELYIKPSSGNVKVAFIRVDYADSPVDVYFSGKTSDTPYADYQWAGTPIYYVQSTALALGTGDTTPPSTPANLTAHNASADTLDLAWDASTDNVAVTGYNVYQDGVKLTTVTPPNHSYRLLDASNPAVAQTYTVTAVDAAGNESAHSNMVASQPPPPTNLRQTGALWYHIGLEWDPVPYPPPPLPVAKYMVWTGLSYDMDDTDYPGITETHWTSSVGAGGADDKRYAVTALNDAGESALSNKITGGSTVPVPPNPTFSVGSVTSYTAKVYWPTAVLNYGTGSLAGTTVLKGYWIEVDEHDGPPAYIANGTILPPGTTSYTITGLKPDRTYEVMVLAEDTNGLTGGPNHKVYRPTSWPNPGYFYTPPTNNTPPTQVTGLRTVSVGDTTVSLAWNLAYDPDDPDNRPTYDVYDYGGYVGTTRGQGDSSSDDQKPSLTLTGMPAESNHVFTVKARDHQGAYGEPSDPLPVTLLGGTPPPPDEPPTTPGALTVTGTTDTTIGLAWTASTDDIGVAGYNVYQDGVRISGDEPSTGITYTAIGLTPGKQYSYRVRAVDTIGQLSALSAAVNATTTGTAPPPDEPPSAPTGLVVTGVADTTIGLAWDASTDDIGVAGYRVYRDGIPLTGILTETVYTATELTPGTQYSFTVKASDTIGQASPASNAVTATTTGVGPIVPAPTGLNVTAVDDTTIGLVWGDPDDPGIAGYHVYRGGVKLTGTPIIGTVYTAAGLTPGTQYSFTVKAVDELGNLSAASNAVTATTTGTAPPPTGPPPVTVTGNTVAAFLQQPDNGALVALSDPLAETVTLLAQGYTRGVGFTAGQPNQEIAAVITIATARLAAHPEQIPVTVGSVQHTGGGFNGWTLTERYVLDRYRKRWT